jgi:predicted TIM-barrel fold metal-dependent hydrolase
MGALTFALAFAVAQTTATPPPPIIDMHMHAKTADWLGPPPVALCIPLHSHFAWHDPKQPFQDRFVSSFKRPPCAKPFWSPATDEDLLQRTLAVMKRRNVIGILSGQPELLQKWRAASPDRFIPSVELEIDGKQLSPTSILRLIEARQASVLGEVTNQFSGVAPDDERMRPYWALAEALDIPVGIHMQEGPPGAAFLFPAYRVRLSNPLLLEDVLVRHPKLRVFVMHYGTPFLDEMVAMLHAYPNLYVETGGIQWAHPREYFYAQLKQLIDAGLGKRVMFGSDTFTWPELLEVSIQTIEEAPFLSPEQKRDILYNNAARFLRLASQGPIPATPQTPERGR